MSRPSWIGYTLGGRYKIESLLGQGGMSAVYKGTDPNLRRTVAIKMIHSHLTGDPEFVRRFEAEAAAVAQLRHPNIIQVYDFNHDDETYYMVLEFVPGETLHTRLQRLCKADETMPLPEALNILAAIADAVEYAHRRGLIHRDIKPANIMIDPHGTAVLMDFGVAKILGGAQHTATGAVVGTALYISPEQVMGQRPTERSDIYSLGVTLFEMVTGRPPFEGDSAMSIMLKHVNEPVPDIRDLKPGTPPDVVGVIQRSLAKDPADRYQSAGEMAAALREAASRLSSGGATVIETLSPPPPTSAATVVEPPPPAGASPRAPAGTTAGPAAGTFAGSSAGTAAGVPPRSTERAPAAPPPPGVPPAGAGARSPEPAQPAAPPRRRVPLWLLLGIPLIALLCVLGVAGGAFGLASLFPGAAPAATETQPAPTEVGGGVQATATAPGPAVTATATVPEPTATATPEPTATEIPVPEGMVFIPGGTFDMGSEQGAADEQPVHTVSLDPFFIGIHEVTNADYHRCVDAGACQPPAVMGSFNRFSYYDNEEFADHPVVSLTWDQAQQYCNWRDGRLPTEAEWEYVASGGQALRYPWGDEFDASRVPAAEPDTVRVGTFSNGASAFGTFDMAGNVLEWVADWYNPDYYAESAEQNPTGPESGTERVLRGGSFGAQDASLYTTTRRFHLRPSVTEVDVGFRCAASLP